ncbi:hypothetical protein ACFC0P_46025, partial [Streptomyces broussonetiae]
MPGHSAGPGRSSLPGIPNIRALPDAPFASEDDRFNGRQRHTGGEVTVDFSGSGFFGVFYMADWGGLLTLVVYISV